ncbi:MAG: glutamate racemase, partial [Flavobacteriaceae bacterium]|nr:glutamate racemase [Flavobacteriaceae bacterium]
MDKAIGLFDSGIGGLSILNSLVEKLPYENFVYLSDNKNCPYGNKSQEQIINFSLKNSKKLIELNCKMIIVACNTA